MRRWQLSWVVPALFMCAGCGSEEPAPTIATAPSGMAPKVAAIPRERPPNPLPNLIRSLQSKDRGARETAVEAIDKLRDPSAVTALVQALRDPDGYVAEVASNALGHIGSPAVPALIASLKKSNSYVRQFEISALGITSDSRAIPYLKRATRDKDWEVAQTATRALTYFRSAGVDQLIEALQSSNPDERWNAANSLSDMGSIAVPKLLTFLSGHAAYSRRSAAWALANLPEGDARASAALLHALRQRDNAVIAGGCSYFVRRAVPGSEKQLVTALRSDGDKHCADELLSCGNPRLEKAARAWAEDNGFQTITVTGIGGGGPHWGEQ